MKYSSVVAWDRLAHWFQINRASKGSDYDLIQEPALMELVGDVAGESILDIGCGFGALAIELAKKKAQVTAFDPSAQMIALARRGAEESHQQVNFVQTTMAEFQEKYASLFDTVLSVNTLRYLDDPAALVELATSHLAPKGRFILSDVHPIANAGGKPGEMDERKVSQYFDRSPRDITFQREDGEREDVRINPRPLADIFALLTSRGLAVTTFLEPQPKEERLCEENRKYYDVGNRFPMYYVIEAVQFCRGSS